MTGLTTNEYETDVCPRGFRTFFVWPSPLHLLDVDHAKVYNKLLPFSLAGTLIVATLMIPLLRSLALHLGSKALHSNRRPRWIMIFAANPLILAVLNLIVVVSPRAWKLLHVLQACYEGLAFWAFLAWVITFLGNAPGDVEASLQTMASTTPRRIWLCPTKRAPTSKDLSLIRCLVFQFVLVVIGSAIYVLDDYFAEEHANVLALLYFVSIFAALFGELTILRIAHDRMHGQRPHLKLWILKFAIVATRVTERIVHKTSTSVDLKSGDLCYTSETLDAAWTSAIITWLMIISSLLACCAFRTDMLPASKEAEPSERPAVAHARSNVTGGMDNSLPSPDRDGTVDSEVGIVASSGGDVQDARS